MSKELVITTTLKVDILDLVDSAAEWVALSGEEQSKIASDYFDEHPNEGWSFEENGDWSEEEEKEIGDYLNSLEKIK